MIVKIEIDEESIDIIGKEIGEKSGLCPSVIGLEKYCEKTCEECWKKALIKGAEGYNESNI